MPLVSYEGDPDTPQDANGRAVHVGDDVRWLDYGTEGCVTDVPESGPLKGRVYVRWHDWHGDHDESPSNLEVI